MIAERLKGPFQRLIIDKANSSDWKIKKMTIK